MGQTGILFKAIRRKWLPIVQAQEVTYIKPINPFQRFAVLTRLSYWDDKYWYIEHRFVVGDEPCAIVQVRGVFVHGRSIIPMSDLLALSGHEIEAPVKPDNVQSWHNLIAAKANQ